MNWTALKKFVPPNAAAKVPMENPACPLNGRDVFRALSPHKVIVMACNIRIPSVIPGIMRAADELGAVVAFELAKTEGNVDGGYTGMNPGIFVDTIFSHAGNVGFSVPFLIHGDHITVKNTSPKEIEDARALIAAELSAGYTSFAIDASFNPIPDNARITALLSGPILERKLGLEVEVGEIKSAGSESALSTVEEAVTPGEARCRGLPPIFAVSNGSARRLRGGRSSSTWSGRGRSAAVRGGSASISPARNHGCRSLISPADIRKETSERDGSTRCPRPDAVDARLSQARRDIKFATKPFKREIDAIPAEYAEDRAGSLPGNPAALRAFHAEDREDRRRSPAAKYRDKEGADRREMAGGHCAPQAWP
jgi:fructose-bisphosphate aldolase class II